MADKDTFKVTEKSAKYRTEIQQMMFVSGEPSEPSVEATTLVESIVQGQVIELLRSATALAARRGVRSISVEDLIFMIRHDRAKVSRLRTFLSWKDVRKTARDSDDKPGGGDDIPLDGAEAGPGQGAPDAAAKQGKTRRAKVRLPWDVGSFYSVFPPEREGDDAEEEEDEEEKEQASVTLARLQMADERTRDMTREEYVHWSECRQASFTFRKGKRFREWAGFGVVTDSKPNDDVVDILGFLTYEIVERITEEALRVKAAEEAARVLSGGAKDGGKDGAKGGEDGEGGEEGAGKKRKREVGLFERAEEETKPVQPKHIQEAFRRLQQPSKKIKMLGGQGGGIARRPLKLI